MKKISLKEQNKICLLKIPSFLKKKIPKNIGTAHLDRCIKQFRYFRIAIITSYVVSDWIRLLKVGRIWELNMYVCCFHRFRVKKTKFVNYIQSLIHLKKRRSIYLVRVNFLCDFRSSFCFKLNPIWPAWNDISFDTITIF